MTWFKSLCAKECSVANVDDDEEEVYEMMMMLLLMMMMKRLLRRRFSLTPTFLLFRDTSSHWGDNRCDIASITVCCKRASEHAWRMKYEHQPRRQ
jgi:hypothetical protein